MPSSVIATPVLCRPRHQPSPAVPSRPQSSPDVPVIVPVIVLSHRLGRHYHQASLSSVVPVLSRPRPQSSPSSVVSVLSRPRSQSSPSSVVPVLTRPHHQSSPSSVVLLSRPRPQSSPSSVVPVLSRPRPQSSPSSVVPVLSRPPPQSSPLQSPSSSSSSSSSDSFASSAFLLISNAASMMACTSTWPDGSCFFAAFCRCSSILRSWMPAATRPVHQHASREQHRQRCASTPAKKGPSQASLHNYYISARNNVTLTT